ncbi:MAG: phosphopantetheine-binding protein [Clostridiaceae bacterium]|nr:phosphopantetheine-binding protein [Clostridiaceae bacterium]
MDKLLSILQDLHPDVDFGTRTDLIDGCVLDSFDIVTLISEIDHEFDVQIPAEEIMPENFNSAAALDALITRLAED